MIDLGARLAEQGLVPLPFLRMGIQRLLRERLRDIAGATTSDIMPVLQDSPIAIETDAANAQHYEVPAAFFKLVLGQHRKYSAAYWPDGVTTLDDAEEAALELVCERAELEDGQDILELGCGWGSLSLFMANRYPNARVVAVSNSQSQRTFINARKPDNLEVVTADVNQFVPDRQFDRIVSVEMFEHVRNYATLLKRIAGWLRDNGRLFVHVFAHRDHPYLFETTGAHDWMGRHFFTGGIMPSVELLPAFDEDLYAEQTWILDGTHYQRTAAAWRLNLERNKRSAIRLFEKIYCQDPGILWYHRWRLFFLACEELFGYAGGSEWVVAHYLFAPRTTAALQPERRLASVG